MNLNDEQKAAVDYLDGPAVIVAGPGSGKTRVIISKIEHLVKQAAVEPGRILAITFSNKSAEEMLERITLTFLHRAHEFNISTFHSFCWDIVREFADDIGFKENVRVLDGTGSWIVTRRRIEDFELRHFLPKTNPFKHVADLVRHIGRAKDETVTPDDYARYAAGVRAAYEAEMGRLTLDDAQARLAEVERTEEVARFYASYQTVLKAENSVDYGDMIAMAVAILREHPDICHRIQGRYDFVLVDEFQDTNISQIELLNLLTGSGRKVCVVGDPDQSIYRFRGASFASFARFDELYAGRQVFALTQNYRSTRNILSVAKHLISNNSDRYRAEKELWTDNGTGDKVTVIKAPSYVAEAEAVAGEILRLAGERDPEDRRLSDFAILYRAHGHREEFEKALVRRRIPYRILGGAGFYKKEEIRDIAALVRVVSGRADGVSLFRVLSLTDFAIPATDLQRLTGWARSQELGLEDAVRRIENVKDLSKSGLAGLLKARQYLADAASSAAAKPASEACREIIDSTWILKRYLHDDSPDSRQRVANLGKYLRKVQEFETFSEDKSLAAFADYQDMLFEAGADEEEEPVEDSTDAVQLMTVHAAKGLEWPFVFVACLCSRRFPTTQKKEEIPFPDELMKEPLPPGDFHEREERRLAYVAFTRARERLYLTCVEKKGVKPSVFVQEALEAGDAIRLVEVPEVDFDSSVEPASDIDLLERDVRRTIMTQLDRPEDLRKTVGLLSFAMSLRESSDGQNWGKKLSEFRRRSDLHIDPALEERVTELLAYRVLIDAAGRDIPERSLHLSYSQINTYEECPMAYKFGCIFKIPGKPQPYFSFGSSVHLALRRFFERVRAGENPSLDDLLRLYKEHWQRDGYALKAQEEAYWQEGKHSLGSVYERHQGRPIKPLELEWKFTLPVGPHFVHGFIDRIDPIGGGKCEVIDYKTGKPKEQKDVDADLQLSLYALAVRECLGLVPERLSLYFLSSDEIVSSSRTETQLEEVKTKVLSVADLILSGDFQPTSDHFRCGRCDYAALCPARES